VRFPWWRRERPASRPLSTLEGYALWADSYPPRPHNPLMEIEQSIVAPMLADLAPRQALDVGTGTGRCRELLAAAGALRVVGVDRSVAMLERSLDRHPRVCGDACRLPFADRTFDVVCASLMAGDLPDLTSWIDEATRVLVPGGHLVYSDFHPSWAARGWRRTFQTSDGRQVELAYFPHTMEDHIERLNAAELSIRAIREPRHASQPDPLVVVFHAVKPGPVTSVQSAVWRPVIARAVPNRVG
jgi:malonyl-CoA O-methyltransferase